MNNFWRKCSVCKDEIGFSEPYYKCSVSTCNKVGRESVFCSMQCFDAHVPVMNHKEAWNNEELSPAAGSVSVSTQNSETPREGVRRVIRDLPSRSETTTNTDAPEEILVVVSKLKDYINQKAGMNTAGSVPSVISSYIRRLCNQAIKNAEADGRKTVMDRDFKDY
jgi:histone H3/H4